MSSRQFCFRCFSIGDSQHLKSMRIEEANSAPGRRTTILHRPVRGAETVIQRIMMLGNQKNPRSLPGYPLNVKHLRRPARSPIGIDIEKSGAPPAPRVIDLFE